MRDEVEEEYDDALATFVINSHMKNHPSIQSMFAEAENEAYDEEQRAEKI